MKKRTRLRYIIIFCLFLMVQAGCSNQYAGDELKQSGEDTAIFSEYEYDQERAQLLSRYSPIAISEKGYYYIVNSILCFYDINNDLSTALCSRVDCDHKGSDCDAYVYSTSPTSFEDLSCNCLDKMISYYNESLYMIERTTDNEFYLCQYNSSFNDKEVLSTLASIKDDQTIVINADTSIISNGYLYYYVAVNDSQYAQKDYMITYQCRRVKLEKGADAEILGEFEFPGDYALKTGDSQGLGILISKENVYYVAGGSARWYTANNPVQYMITRYNTVSGAFDTLWTYVGKETLDVWGEGTGNVGSFSGGNAIFMDESANLYLVTASEQIKNRIVKIDLVSNSAKVIYTTSHDEIQSVKCDGEHLFFFETDMGKASYFTAIDKEGNVIASQELEYTDEYLEYFEAYKKAHPDMKVGMPVASDKDVIIYGVDDRYISIICYADADVFKGLTSIDIRTYHDLNKDDFEESTVVGMGVIQKELFLKEGKSEIKQVYQYKP